MSTESHISLYLVPLGGLCNRLRAIMSAISLAQELRSPLHVIWLRDAGLNARFADLFAPLTDALLPADVRVPLSLADSSRRFVYGVARRRNLRLPSLWQRCMFDTCLTEEELMGIMNACPSQDGLSDALRKRLRGRVLIQTGLGFYPADDSLLTHFFVPSADVRALLEKRLKLLTPYTVGLHIRRTDNRQAALFSPLAAFEAAMAADVRRAPQTVFYLATDDASVAAALAAAFPDKIFTSAGPASGVTPVSVAPAKGGFYAARSSVRGMQDAVAELFTLIACPRFHGSYWSSFSDAVVGCHADGTADIVHVST